jgi:hypothetical protein
MLKMPIAIIALIAPGPKTAVIITAESNAGKAKTRSLKRIKTSSIKPPVAAPHKPRGTPMPAPITTETDATAMELRLPTMIIDRMSRPK